MENTNAAKAQQTTIANDTTATIDTHGMTVIHRGLRRESRLLAQLISEVAPGDSARAAVLAAHLRDYLMGLHNHHHGEDEHLWPALLSRVDLETDLVLRMEAQHERIAESMNRAEAALPAWESGAGEDARDALVAALVDHRAVLVEHLDDEETELLPLAARLVTQREWDAMGEHFQNATPKPKLLLFLGITLEEATSEERAAMLGGLPWFARGLWYAIGRPQYTRHMRAVRGAA